jgi:glycosyltransferase involved in cell wall biosynthesis
MEDIYIMDRNTNITMEKSQIIFFSIIVTVKNEAKTIEKCLNSLINQSYPIDLYEILVVDGRSTDCTHEIVQNIKKNSSIHIEWIEQTGFGISNARNIGVEKAKGNLILFIDGDAYAVPNLLKNYSDCLIDENNNVGYFWGPVIIANEENIIAKSIYISYYSLIGSHGANILYKKSALKAINGFDEDFFGRGDEVVVNYKIKNKGYRSKKCESGIVYHVLPTSIFEFLKIRYNDGISLRKIYSNYFHQEEKLKTNFIFLIKFCVLVTLLIFVSLLLTNIFNLILFFCILFAGLVLLYTRFGVVLKIHDIIPLIIGIILVTIGHMIELIGELNYYLITHILGGNT